MLECLTTCEHGARRHKKGRHTDRAVRSITIYQVGHDKSGQNRTPSEGQEQRNWWVFDCEDAEGDRGKIGKTHSEADLQLVTDFAQLGDHDPILFQWAKCRDLSLSDCHEEKTDDGIEEALHHQQISWWYFFPIVPIVYELLSKECVRCWT